MTKFGDTKAAEHDFSNYQIAGWVKVSELQFIVFDIQGVEFRKRASHFTGEQQEEYVMFVTFPDPRDVDGLELPDPEAMYGVSGTHYRIMSQLKDMDQDEFPIEGVSIAQNETRAGNSAYELVDPISFGLEPGRKYGQTSQVSTAGRSGERSTVSATNNIGEETRAQQPQKNASPTTSTTRPTVNRTPPAKKTVMEENE